MIVQVRKTMKHFTKEASLMNFNQVIYEDNDQLRFLSNDVFQKSNSLLNIIWKSHVNELVSTSPIHILDIS